MDENAKEYLYEQLEQIVQYSVKEDKEELISKEKFMEMTGAECLRYVFEYRDNNEPYEFNGEKGEAYIQVPNIDLSNEDLNDVILRGFILSHPENDDEVISSINFANTGITLDLNSILENQTEQTGTTNKRIIDFSQCNFEGCTIYGILPDEYQSETAKITDGYEVRGREKLGEEYTKRREKLHDVQAPKTLSRRAYERLIDGRDFSRLNGITDATEIHLEDLDFDTNDEQGLGKMYQTLYGELETRENLNGIYTNMNLSSEFIRDTYKKLTSEYAKGKFLQELIRQGKELDFVKEKFNELDYSNKKEVLQELVGQEKEFEFVFENARYIQDEETKKKVKEQAQQRGISETKMEWQLKPNGDNLLEIIDEDIEFVKSKFDGLYYGDEKSQVLQELIRQGKELEFVKEKFESLVGKDKYQVLQELVRQGKELDFVKENFDELNGEYEKSKALQELIRQGKELDFVKEKFEELEYSDYHVKVRVLQELIRQGKELDFVKSKFDGLYYGDEKSQMLQELIRQGKELDFVKEKFNDLGNKYKSKVLQELVRQGKELDFVKENFDELNGEYEKSKVLQELVRQGKELDFVKSKFDGLYYGDEKSQMLQELIRQGKELDFVKSKFDGLSMEYESQVLQELIRQGKELDFVKEKYEDLSYIGRSQVLQEYSYEYKSQVLQELIRQGKELDFVKEKFNELDYSNKKEVLQELVRQGKEFEFVFENARYIQDEETKKKVKEQAQQRGISEKKMEWQLKPNGDNLLEIIDEDIEFVKSKFDGLYYWDEKSKVLQELVRQGKELEFVKEKFESLVGKDKYQVLQELIRQGKELDFVKSKFDGLFMEYESQVLQELIRQGKELDFVKENFEGLANEYKNQILQELIRRGEHQELVNEYWRYIKGNQIIEIDSNQFRNIVGCGEKETQELIKLIERSQISLTELIRKKAILASCGIDIKDALKNRTLMQTSPVVLYAKKRYYESVGQPTNISNLGMSRAKFENMSGKTLTGICNEYVFSDRYDNLKDTVVEEINKEIQEQKEKKAKQSKNMPNQQQSRIEAKSNSKAHKVNPVVSTFLQTQVGISETQEQKLGEWLQRFNYDIYSQNVEEDLALKKQILDQFGVTSQAFGMSCKILTIPLKTLYARAQFLKDIGEKVIPANLMATLGANGDIFAQKYGSYFMEEKSKQDAQYIMNVENATNENYPMPKTKEEIIRKIKEMEEKQK